MTEWTRIRWRSMFQAIDEWPIHSCIILKDKTTSLSWYKEA